MSANQELNMQNEIVLSQAAFTALVSSQALTPGAKYYIKDDGSVIVQVSGQQTDKVMSQKAVTDYVTDSINAAVVTVLSTPV